MIYKDNDNCLVTLHFCPIMYICSWNIFYQIHSFYEESVAFKNQHVLLNLKREE